MSASATAGTSQELIGLHDVPGLPQTWIADAHRRHLNPALMTLMRLGGYDDVRVVRAEGPYLFTADGRRLLDLVSAYGALSHGHNHPRVVAAARWFDDTGDKPPIEFQEEWHELLRMNNLFQFTPRFVSFTKLMVEKGLVSNAISWLLDTDGQPESTKSDSTLNETQIEELGMLDPLLQPVLIPLLKNAKVPWPEFGYEAIDDQGRCGTSMLEVAWPKLKVGIALPTDDISGFEKSGWIIIHLSDLDETNFEALLNPES